MKDWKYMTSEKQWHAAKKSGKIIKQCFGRFVAFDDKKDLADFKKQFPEFKLKDGSDKALIREIRARNASK